MPIKYAVPAGSARTRLLIALAARYTGGTVRGWDVWDGLDTHPASQISGRFGYSFGKTRVDAHLVLAMSYGELGQDEKARAEAAEVLRINPKFSVEVLRQASPIKDRALRERLFDGLRKAGLK